MVLYQALVLANLPTYFMSMFPMPDIVAIDVEREMRNFIWDGSSDGNLCCLLNQRVINWGLVV